MHCHCVIYATDSLPITDGGDVTSDITVNDEYAKYMNTLPSRVTCVFSICSEFLFRGPNLRRSTVGAADLGSVQVLTCQGLRSGRLLSDGLQPGRPQSVPLIWEYSPVQKVIEGPST